MVDQRRAVRPGRPTRQERLRHLPAQRARRGQDPRLMDIRALSIEGSFEITPRVFPDDRGVFLESFRGDKLAQVIGHRLDIIQTNVSVSSRGTVRGVHFATPRTVPRDETDTLVWMMSMRCPMTWASLSPRKDSR